MEVKEGEYLLIQYLGEEGGADDSSSGSMGALAHLLRSAHSGISLMDQFGNQHKIDIGRLFITPVFAFLITVNIYALHKDAAILLPINTIKLAALINHLLLVCFYGLLILLYFLRSSAISTNRSIVTSTIAIVATFIPFAFPLLKRAPLCNPTKVLTANLIIFLGMLLSVYALNALGRNISIIPQARKLAQKGPYRMVRHPLYLGELIGALGIVLSDLTMPKIALFLLLTALQVYRAFQEEKILSAAFQEYGEYCLRTARLIPGVF